MALQQIQQYNMFLDTGRCLSANSTGDSVALPLGQTPITAQGPGQSIRLTLNQFTMAKSWFNVNVNNNQCRLRQALNVSPPEVIFAVPPNNYGSIYDMMVAFIGSPANQGPFTLALLQLGSIAAAGAVVNTIVFNNPTSPAQNFENNTNIIDFTIKFTAVIPNLSTTPGGILPIFQTFTQDGDAFLLLGGKRINDLTNISAFSWETSYPSPSTTPPGVLDEEIRFRGYYNALLATENFAYVRINEQNTNIANTALSAGSQDTQRTEMTNTRILGIVAINSPVLSYVAQTQDVFYTDILAKQVSQLTISVTDKQGRDFPLINPTQNVLGNRSFEACIQVTILQGSPSIFALPYTALPETTPANQSTQPVAFLRNGIAAFGLNNPGQTYGNGFFGTVDGKLKNAYG